MRAPRFPFRLASIVMRTPRGLALDASSHPPTVIGQPTTTHTYIISRNQVASLPIRHCQRESFHRDAPRARPPNLPIPAGLAMRHMAPSLFIHRALPLPLNPSASPRIGRCGFGSGFGWVFVLALGGCWNEWGVPRRRL
ncbi:hypothetical protein DFH09DRAFT_1165672 [Mycena vulgaris]|nr:hypothetical protein DFH09DRAFT_1165672 [Mycena vulgaris]